MNPLRLAPLVFAAAAACMPEPQPAVDGAGIDPSPLPGSIRQQVVEGGPNPAAVTLTINNNGNCALNWSRLAWTVDGNNWLSVTPSTGTVPAGGTGALTVTFDVVTPALRPATYTGTIRLYGTCATTGGTAVGAPLYISVNLTVTATVAGLSTAQTELEQDVTPLMNAWSPLSTLNAPAPRKFHTATWTGSFLAIFGGNDGGGTPLTGGVRYDPVNGYWQPFNAAFTPAPRWGHTAVSTGTKVIYWGGRNAGMPLNTGGLLDCVGTWWATMSSTGAPSARYGHSAVWAYNRMLVWGGHDGSTEVNTGGRYDPVTDTWSPMSTVNAPTPRQGHLAVWTGSDMFVWGGFTATGGEVSGAPIYSYSPSSDTWTTFMTTNAPTGRRLATAVYTGRDIIVFGGMNGSVHQAGGAAFRPGSVALWRTLSTVGAPPARAAHTAVWTGSQMLIWGGDEATGALPALGYRYNPVADTWSTMTTVGAPAGRKDLGAVWTGTSLMVWGGDQISATTDTGGIYQ